MSRNSSIRRALAGVAVTALALAAAACGGGDSGETSAATPDALNPSADLKTQTLTVSNWDAYMPEDLPAKFEQKFGSKVTVTKHATNEEVMAKLTAGGDSGIDVAFVSGPFAQALAEQGLTEPIHPELIPNLGNLYPEASQLAYDVGNKFSVPYTWGTTGLCYRSDVTGYDPDSWNDLLTPRPELAKKITMLQTDRWLMLPAQKALGYSANTKNADEMAKVKEKLLAAKPNLLAFDDTTFYERLVSGEAALVEAWDGWCNYGITDNAKIKFAVPKEGSDLFVDTMVILKTSKNKEAAHAFINYILDPGIHTWTVENILYKVPNKAAMEALDPALAKKYPNLAMIPAELMKQETLVDLGEAATDYSRIVTEVAAS
ncbi:spermidine/putrescine ABC transporter substrate-binding protein [Actinoplanes sp. LDG1-06]|uniref:Spermidine/putrescine ABC transporter substrate-binding protein n=1 Tax=Paractinoplanes ovalisporus TaxID=2810368 RepID=A0ABS2A733_9ACTN|nr:spermidine/putrescine ABC transporter substrate-binding protein [Actinoplanes ovalisporus]MBM2615530.1 spermidine/putrescine ABC transporter substrate-binding protein [Actinoplanes ovalisporus]